MDFLTNLNTNITGESVLVSHESVEQDFAMNRQFCLCEQGYESRLRRLSFCVIEEEEYGQS